MSGVQDQVFDIMNEGGSKIDLFDFRGTHGGGSTADFIDGNPMFELVLAASKEGNLVSSELWSEWKTYYSENADSSELEAYMGMDEGDSDFHDRGFVNLVNKFVLTDKFQNLEPEVQQRIIELSDSSWEVTEGQSLAERAIDDVGTMYGDFDITNIISTIEKPQFSDNTLSLITTTSRGAPFLNFSDPGGTISSDERSGTGPLYDMEYAYSTGKHTRETPGSRQSLSNPNFLYFWKHSPKSSELYSYIIDQHNQNQEDYSSWLENPSEYKVGKSYEEALGSGYTSEYLVDRQNWRDPYTTEKITLEDEDVGFSFTPDEDSYINELIGNIKASAYGLGSDDR
tara:strand:+ start:121 stop:1143 length:1023 start_codon:yes stop_codon:yes gene_type:complete